MTEIRPPEVSTRFWWVRHGPTYSEALVGWRDIPADLSDRLALERLSRFLPSRAVVIASDLERASTTADCLSGPFRHRLPDEAALREFNFGDWDGVDFSVIGKKWPFLSRRYWDEPGDVAPPNGESWYQAAERASAVVTRLASTHMGCDIVIVAHYGIILSQYADAAGISPAQALQQVILPLSVTRLDLLFDGFSVSIVNHLL